MLLEVTVTVAELEVTTLPPASSTLTIGCVPSEAPQAPPTGCVVMAILLAAPTVTVTLFETAEVSPLEAKVSV